MASKTIVSTNSTTWADKKKKVVGRVGIDEGVSQRIYSPPHLTTLEPTHTGATNQTWTDDHRFTNQELYQLSYGGTGQIV